MKVLVTGSRYSPHKQAIYSYLTEFHSKHPIDLLIVGDAKRWDKPRKCWVGVDYYAWQWAIETDIPYLQCKADWERYGSAAGPIRNNAMLLLGPHVVLAFPGGRGTKDCVRQAIRANIPIIEVE